MRSINFTCLKEKLLDGSKTQTYRVLFVPSVYPGDIVTLKFEKKPLLQAEITEVYPRRLGDLTPEEARRDGFATVEEMKDAIKKLNGVRDDRHWGFVIRWRPVPDLRNFMNGGGKMNKKCPACGKKITRGDFPTVFYKGKRYHRECFDRMEDSEGVS